MVSLSVRALPNQVPRARDRVPDQPAVHALWVGTVLRYRFVVVRRWYRAPHSLVEVVPDTVGHDVLSRQAHASGGTRWATFGAAKEQTRSKRTRAYGPGRPRTQRSGFARIRTFPDGPVPGRTGDMDCKSPIHGFDSRPRLSIKNAPDLHRCGQGRSSSRLPTGGLATILRT